MLENLDKINWASLGHAYGPADDVPALIRQLASPDAEVRDETYYELHGNIWHQGTVYEATGYAVPFLIELLEVPEVEDKNQLLYLLEAIAHGSSYNEAHQDLEIFTGQSQPDFLPARSPGGSSWIR